MIYYFLPFIIIVGLFTSYHDIKYHKIKNKWIIYSIIVSIILNIIFFIKDFNTIYYSQFITNLILTIIICIILWLYKFWPAGDAKLIIAYTFLIPTTIYTLNNLKYFYSFSLLVNIFVPYFVFFTFYFLLFQKKQLIPICKKINYKQLIRSILLIFFILWPINYLSNFIPLLNNFFLKIFLILVFYSIINSIINKLFKQSIIFYIFLALIRILFEFNTLLNLNFLKVFLVYYLFFFFIRFFIMEIANHEKKQTLPFAPFAFIGTILTIISKGMFINLILFLLKLTGWS